MTVSLVVVNPAASRIRDPVRRRALVARLATVLERRDGRPPEVVETRSPEETGPLVGAALQAGAGRVVGVGGDGTLRAIATVLCGTSVPLGIVPAGTGNLLGGSLGVPGGMERAIDALGSAGPRSIDLGEVRMELRPEPGSGAMDEVREERAIFAIGCGIGFDARVMAATPSDLKRRVGRMAYFAQALLLAPRLTAIPHRVTIDGRLFELDASIAMATNMGQLIPGLLAPRLPIVPDDGLLDVIVVGARGPVHGVRGLADQLWRTSLGAASGSDTLRARGRVVRIESDVLEPLQVDGDHLGWGSLEASVLEGALRILVPARTGASSDGAH